MDRLRALLRRLDRFQRDHRRAAFGYAVVKKYGEDNAGNAAALLAYYAFFSIFPLLLVLVTVLGLALRGDPHLQSEVLNSSLKNLPVLGPQLRGNIHALHGSGLGLAAGIVGTFIGARGVASAAQNSFNTIWHVPAVERPGFPANQLRNLAIVTVFGGGLLVSATAQTAIAGLHPGGAGLGIGLRVAGYAGATVINVVVFLAGFRLATAPCIPTRWFWRSALAAALLWELLEGFGGFILAHELRKASSVYGTFALVIGLLYWFHLQAQLTFYAVEADTVRAGRYWPRALTGLATVADRQTARSVALASRRRREERIEVSFDDAATDATMAPPAAVGPAPEHQE